MVQTKIENYESLLDVAEKWQLSMKKLLILGSSGRLEICVLPDDSWLIDPGVYGDDPDYEQVSSEMDEQGNPKMQPTILRVGFHKVGSEEKFRPEQGLPLPLLPSEVKKFETDATPPIALVRINPLDPTCIGHVSSDAGNPKVGKWDLFISKKEQRRYEEEMNLVPDFGVSQERLRMVLDKEHPYHSSLLALAIRTWVHHYAQPNEGTDSITLKKIKKWIEANNSENLKEKDRATGQVATVLNPDRRKGGGAPPSGS